LRRILFFTLLISPVACAQQAAVLPEAPQPAWLVASSSADSAAPLDGQSQSAVTASAGKNSAEKGNPETTNPSQQQPKRILGIMPNYRAVSADAIPPPPTAKEAFVTATQNSFDYSSVVFVGITSLWSKGTESHPQLGKDMPAYWGYYWRGFADKTIGNYFVIFAYPTLFRQDTRYFAKGKGPIFRRGDYAASRVLITPSYSGRNTFNISEILGRGSAQAISTTYYPSADRTAGQVTEKLAFAIGRDALMNVFREFWPDIATHFLHRQP